MEQIRDQDQAFRPLLGAYQQGWVIGGESCAILVEDFEKYEAAFLEAHPREAELYLNMALMMEKLAGDGVICFY